jgi:glutamate/aspartate transport system ATP-binding protein
MIEIRGISKWYGSVQVLSDCRARVDRGAVVVVCGPSGSGKSTRIKTVNALEPFERGTSSSTAWASPTAGPTCRRCVGASAGCSSTSSCSRTCR